MEDPGQILDPFERVVNSSLPSIVSIAFGTKESGIPNMIGTGFGLTKGQEDEKTQHIATCWHVADRLFEISSLTDDELRKEGLIDKTPRIIQLIGNIYECKDISSWKISFLKLYDDIEYVRRHDLCIIKIDSVEIPPLCVSSVNPRLGSEVAIIGFPTFDKLQKGSIQPYIIKSIISSSLYYPFEINGGEREVISERIALGSTIGMGFSGSPVISVKDAKVVGMIDYVPPEMDICDIKIKCSSNKPIIFEGDAWVGYPAGICLAIPALRIGECLDLALGINQEMSTEDFLKWLNKVGSKI